MIKIFISNNDIDITEQYSTGTHLLRNNLYCHEVRKIMSLIDYYSNREIEDFRRTANRLFGFNDNDRFATPAVDIMETEDEFIFELDLPGFTKDQIDISAAADSLTIKAERERTNDEEVEGRFIRRERQSFKFSRTFNFTKPVSPETAKVELANGVLHINMPKSEEIKPKKLEINFSE